MIFGLLSSLSFENCVRDAFLIKKVDNLVAFFSNFLPLSFFCELLLFLFFFAFLVFFLLFLLRDLDEHVDFDDKDDSEFEDEDDEPDSDECDDESPSSSSNFITVLGISDAFVVIDVLLSITVFPELSHFFKINFDPCFPLDVSKVSSLGFRFSSTLILLMFILVKSFFSAVIPIISLLALVLSLCVSCWNKFCRNVDFDVIVLVKFIFS